MKINHITSVRAGSLYCKCNSNVKKTYNPNFEGKYTRLILGSLAAGVMISACPPIGFLMSGATALDFFNELEKEKNNKNKTTDSD